MKYVFDGNTLKVVRIVPNKVLKECLIMAAEGLAQHTFIVMCCTITHNERSVLRVRSSA